MKGNTPSKNTKFEKRKAKLVCKLANLFPFFKDYLKILTPKANPLPSKMLEKRVEPTKYPIFFMIVSCVVEGFIKGVVIYASLQSPSNPQIYRSSVCASISSIAAIRKAVASTNC